MPQSRRTFLKLAAAAPAVLPPLSSARAETFPSRPIKIIAPWPVGGAVDALSRAIGARLETRLTQPVVTENRPGAGSTLGVAAGARSTPDGYSYVLAGNSSLCISAAMYKKLPYDPLKDFAAVSLTNAVPSVLVVHQSVPAKTLPEFIALAKAQPGKFNSVFSMGTTAHVALELFKTMAGVDIVPVTYKSGGLGALDLDAGRVHMSFAVMTTAVSVMKNGRVRALAVTSTKRSPAMPDVPAIAEFLPGFNVIGWQGIVVPARTPHAIVDTLSRHIAKAMHAPDLAERLGGMGSDVIGSTPDEFERFRVEEYKSLVKLLAQSGIKP